jgi:glycosyltransferase involved in cell wall biosynthesis
MAMKILFINSEYPPVGAGAGKASANLALSLVQAGHEVAVITSRLAGLPVDECPEGVRILRGPAPRGRIDRSTAVEQLVFIVGALYRCLTFAPEFRPDVVVAFFGLPSGAIAWVLNKLYGIPYIVSLRGGDVPGFRPYDFWLYHRIAVPLLHPIWRRAAAVVANSAGLRALAERFDSTVDIAVIPNGVDVKQHPVQPREWMPPRILSVGRVVHQKGLDIAMKALAGLHTLDWSWRIAGDGPEMPALKRTAMLRNIADRVVFLGWQGVEELRKEYADSNLFLFPSRHEGMPNAVLEAMASGLPVVASNIAGNEELVVHGKTGFLFPAEDATALETALKDLLTDCDRRVEMGGAGRKRVEEGYGWRHVAEEYLKLLEEAAG